MNTLALPIRILLVTVVLLLSACSVLGTGQRDPVTIYSPPVEIAPDPAWPSVDWQLALVTPTAARVVDSPRIAVRPVPGEIQVYKGVSWSQPPTDMVESILLEGFEDSGKIPGVARSGTGIGARYRLVMDLRRFEADYAGASVPSAVIELNAKLLDVREQRVVATRTFAESRPATGTDVAQVTQAFNQALEQVGGEIIGWTLVSGQADAARTVKD